MRLPRAYLLIAAAGVLGLLLGFVDAVALPVATGAACAAAVGALLAARRAGIAAQGAKKAAAAAVETRGGSIRDRKQIQDTVRAQGDKTRELVKHVPRWTLTPIQRELRTAFAQTEATVGLHSLLRPRAAMPASRGWAASPDVVLELVRIALRDRPSLIVEAGSGLSSLWLGYALELVGQDGRVVSLEHDAAYAEALRARVREHGLEGRVEIRDAALVPQTVEDREVVWYDPAALDGLHGIGLAFVDGPPATTGHQARWAAVPMLADRLAPGARVVLDDLVRDEEKQILELWKAAHPSWTVETFSHEKGTGVLVVDAGPGGAG